MADPESANTVLVKLSPLLFAFPVWSLSPRRCPEGDSRNKSTSPIQVCVKLLIRT